MKNILSLFISIGFYLAIWVAIAFLAGLSLFQFDSSASVYPRGVFGIAIFGYIVLPVIRQFLLYRVSIKRGLVETGMWLIFVGILSFSNFTVVENMIHNECLGYVGAGLTTKVFSEEYCNTHKMPVLLKALEHTFYIGPVSKPYAAGFYSKPQYAMTFTDLETAIKSFGRARGYYIANMECYYSYPGAQEGFYLTKFLTFNKPDDAAAICPEHYRSVPTIVSYAGVDKTISPEESYLIGSGQFIIN